MRSIFWGLGAAALLSCEGKPLVVGHQPPSQSALTDGGTSPGFRTAMGDAFEVEPSIVVPDTGVAALSHAFDGMLHLAAWMSPRGVLAVRFDLDGNRLDSTPLLVAPPELLGTGLLVTARPAGGFEVRWAVADSSASVAGRKVSVERDGSSSFVRSVGGGTPFDVGLSASGAERLVRTVSIEPDIVLLNGGGWLDVPITSVIGDVALARVGGFEFLATIRGDEASRVLELRALAAGDSYPNMEDPGVIVFSTPIVMPLENLLRTRHFALAVADGRVVLVWRERVIIGALPDGGNPSTLDERLLAVSTSPQPSGAFDVVGPVELGAGQGGHGKTGVLNVAAAGSRVVVSVRGVLDRSNNPQAPLFVEVDAQALAINSSTSASQLADATMRGCSWDGQACLVFAGVGDLDGFVGTQRLVPGAAVGALTSEQTLPGQKNAQLDPAVACTSEGCLTAWRQDAEGGSDDLFEVGLSRALRLSGAGELGGGGAIDLFPITPGTHLVGGPLVAAIGSGFVAAELRCTPSATTLVVRALPETGALGAIQEFAFPGLGSVCNGALSMQLPTFSDATQALIVMNATSVLHVDAAGVARLLTTSLGERIDGPIDGVLRGDEAVLSFGSGSNWTTAVLDLQTGSHELGLVNTCPDSECDSGKRKLVLLPGDRVAWIHQTAPDSARQWRITWMELDERAIPRGPSATFASVQGESYRLQVSTDSQGFAVLTPERLYGYEPFQLVFRTFDTSFVPRGEPRVVATGLTTFKHTLAGGNGRWLTSWVYGSSLPAARVPPGADAARVYARFVFEAH